MCPQGSGFVRITCFRLASSTVAFERSTLTIRSLLLYTADYVLVSLSSYCSFALVLL